MRKFPIFIVLISILIVVGGAILATRQPKNNSKTSPSTAPAPTTIEYFWGNGCSHCKNVEDFMSSWDKKDQVKINKMEVWSNKTNQELLIQRAKSCGITENQIGVPLLVTPDGKCFSGDTPIIDYLKSL